MYLIVGLGNPGEKYEKTRHNTGWLVLDKFANQIPNFKFQISNKLQLECGKVILAGKEIFLVKPLTFMNKSGEAVRQLIENCKLGSKGAFALAKQIANLIIVHDDLDIPLGKYKIQFGKGPKEHNGVESVERVLGTKDFWRVRIGIENRDPEKRILGEEYVLQEFTKEQKKIIDQVIVAVVKEIKTRILKADD